MDANPQPGMFLIEAADYGLKAASILTSFATSKKSRDLASKLSISATVLSEVGKEVNKNANYFKDNFQKTFEHVPMKCKEKYEKVLAALDKASSFTKKEPIEGIVFVNIPQTPWSRFLSELDMDKYDFGLFQDSLDEAWKQALMLQYIVSLVVLQIRAQRSEPLPISEYNKLGQLKKGLGKLLESIREEEIASVASFSLIDLKKPANIAQLVEVAESAAPEPLSRDDASIASSSATFLNSPVQEDSPIKQQIPLPPPPLPPIRVSPPREEDEYEMYRVQINTHERERAHTRFRLFGVPGLMNIGRITTVVTPNVDKVPASIGEIKSFISREKDDDYTVPPILNDLVNISPAVSTTIYNLINDKNKNAKVIYPRLEWNAEFLVNWEWWESKRFGRKQQKTEGYIVILRGRTPTTSAPFPLRGGPMSLPPPPMNCFSGPPPSQLRDYSIGLPPPPPPPINRSLGPSRPVLNIVECKKSPVKKKQRAERKVVAQVELTQQETENIINDFLATFSTLYEGISVEQRGAALRGIDLAEMDDLVDYDSDDSSSWSSASSNSLVDD